MKQTITLIIVSILLSSFSPAGAETRTFIKEYTYQASDFDSKISSRTIALEQVKRLLLEEAGTYLASETEVGNFQLTKDRITTLTAGIVQTQIMDERWDGKTYYLKAKMSMDPQEATKLLQDLKANSQKNRELEETNRKVNEALQKLKQLQDELAAGRHPEGRQNEYRKAVDELQSKEWLDKGVGFMNAERYEDALAAFTKAVETDPRNPWAYIDRGWALHSLGDDHQAIRDLNKAAELDPQNPWIYANRGIAYNALGDYRQGLLDGDKTARLDANNGWAYINRGWAYLGLGNYSQALAELTKASQVEPQNSFVYSTRAWAYNALGNARQAVEDLEQSVRLAPNNSWMFWNRAMYYALSGDRRKSLADLGKAIRMNPSLKQRARADKNFQSLWNDGDFRKLVD